MASTNKTPNIALNQWVLEDPFLMEDMNEDNRKIDEDAKRLQGLIDAMPYVKLMDTTTSSDARSVSLSVSGIDFKKYAAIHIFADAVVRDANDEIPSYSNPTLALAINGQGGWFGSTNSGSILPYVACSVQSHYSSCAMQATISGFQYQPHAGRNGTYYHNLAVHSVGAVNREPASHSACACNIGGASSRVTSLDFTARSSENHTMYIKAGSRFVMYVLLVAENAVFYFTIYMPRIKPWMAFDFHRWIVCFQCFSVLCSSFKLHYYSSCLSKSICDVP